MVLGWPTVSPIAGRLLHQPPKGPSSIPPWDRLRGFPFFRHRSAKNRPLKIIAWEGETSLEKSLQHMCSGFNSWIFVHSWGSKRWLFQHPFPTPALQLSILALAVRHGSTKALFEPHVPSIAKVHLSFSQAVTRRVWNSRLQVPSLSSILNTVVNILYEP